MSFAEQLHREHVERQQRLYPRPAAQPQPSWVDKVVQSAVAEAFQKWDAARSDDVALINTANARIAHLEQTVAKLKDGLRDGVVEVDAGDGVTGSMVEVVPSVELIQRIVISYYGIDRNAFLSERRTMAVVRPRQIAMYLCKVMTMRTLPDLGRRFGGRDHTTVLHAVNAIDGRMQANPDLQREVNELRGLILDHMAKKSQATALPQAVEETV